MPNQSIVISGLQGSGKTTFLAALWHLITAREVSTALRFESLRNGNATHLNAIAELWRDTKSQVHTETGSNELVSMNLLDSKNAPARVTFPDLSGEGFRDMWENRECDLTLAEILQTGHGMLFFINADRIQFPLLTVDIAAQAQDLGAPIPPGQQVAWNARLSPTEVQLVDLLQLFCDPPINVGLRRIAIILSLWDKVEIEGLTPEAFLAQKFPLLDQYLRSAADGWVWQVYGVSAQGGEYETDNKQPTPEQLARINELKALDEPSLRIKVVFGNEVSNDLTGPIAWLMS